ncbi:hypothetical protein D3C71_1399760 [compost metagenome]
MQRIGQRLGVLRRHQDARVAVAEHFGYATHIGAHHRQAAGLGFDIDRARRLLLRGQRKHVEPGQQIGHIAAHAHQVDAMLQAQLGHVFLRLLEDR